MPINHPMVAPNKMVRQNNNKNVHSKLYCSKLEGRGGGGIVCKTCQGGRELYTIGMCNWIWSGFGLNW